VALLGMYVFFDFDFIPFGNSVFFAQTHPQTTAMATNPINLATAPPPVQSTYGQTRLRSPPPPAAHEAHAAAAEEDEEGMYASEEPGEEVERGRTGNHAPVVPVEGHAEHEAGVEGQREDAVTGASGDV